MRFFLMFVCLPVVFSVSMALAQGPGGGGQGGGGPQACSCLIQDGTFSCNTYGVWAPNEIPYPCTTVQCVSGACPLQKELTKTRERESEEDWDTLHPKYKAPIHPQQGQALKTAEIGYKCFQDNFCAECSPQEARPSLPVGDYCTGMSENITGLGKFLVCKDAQGLPLPPCPGVIE